MHTKLYEVSISHVSKVIAKIMTDMQDKNNMPLDHVDLHVSMPGHKNSSLTLKTSTIKSFILSNKCDHLHPGHVPKLESE